MSFWSNVGKWIAGAAIVTLGVLSFGVGFVLAAGIGAAVAIGGAVYEGISSLNEQLQKAQNLPEGNYKARKVTSRAPDKSREIVYGKNRIGGQLVYNGSTGTDSQFYHMIVVLAPHVVAGIDEVFIGDTQAFDTSGNAIGDYAGKAVVYKELGAQVVANANAVANIPEWTADHKLLGCAYIYVRIEYDQDLYGGREPVVSAIVRGKSDV